MWLFYWLRSDFLFGVFSATCFLWCFYTEKVLSSFLSELRVTIAILDAAWMTYNGDIFYNHNNFFLNTALNAIAERQRYPAIMADKQSSFPELNTSLRHILILYRWEEGEGWICFWYSEPILPIRRIRKLRRASETPGGAPCSQRGFYLV